jgi:hypothetical protein
MASLILSSTSTVNSDLPLDHFDLSPDAVRGRFQLARRQGRPLWLWPETTTEGWQAALVQIERATRIILTGREGRALLEGSADDIGIAAFTSGMGPLLGYWAGRDLLDAEPPVQSILGLHYRHNCLRMERLATRASEAVEALSAAAVRVTILKGMHTAYSYFPEPGTRPASDIDLLITASDERAAADVLEGLGYLPGAASCGEQSWHMSGSPLEPCSLSLTHRDNPWTIDLHTSLDRRYSPGAPMVALDRALQGRASEPWRLAPEGDVLPPAELALHLAVHASMPFASLTMVRLVELTLVIESIKGNRSPFWERFLALAERSGSASSAFPALHFANRLVEGTVPEAVLMVLERRMPAAVRRVTGRLTPATCQRMRGASVEERFMWTNTFRGWVREVLRDILPSVDLRELLRIYAWRLRLLVRLSAMR